MDKPDFGTPFNKMTRQRKVLWIFKVIVCAITFGMAFPNVMSD